MTPDNDELLNAIREFEARRRADQSMKRTRGQAASESLRFLRAAHLLVTARDLGASHWSRPRERKATGVLRAALWRQVLLISAIEQMHAALPFSAKTNHKVPTRLSSLNVDIAPLPAAPTRPTARLPAFLLFDPKNQKNNSLREYVQGVTPSTRWDALLLGAAVRNHVAHGVLSPTQARRAGLEPLLGPLFEENVRWANALIRSAHEHITNTP
jgi:hypothetical protein